MTNIVPGFFELMHRIHLFTYSFRKLERKGVLHLNSTSACMMTKRNPFFKNMKVIHEYLTLRDSILWSVGAKIYLMRIFDLQGCSRSNPVSGLNSPHVTSY